jgi:hypothetical protein
MLTWRRSLIISGLLVLVGVAVVAAVNASLLNPINIAQFLYTQYSTTLFTMRVVDETGTPVAGAYLDGEVREPFGRVQFSPPKINIRSSSFRGYTDENGEFVMVTQGTVYATVSAERHLPLTSHWVPGEARQDPVLVVLKSAPKAVPMFEIRAGSKWWKEERGDFALGIRLEPVEGLTTQAVQEQENADLWFEFRKEGAIARQPEDVPTSASLREYNTSQWRVEITARNGWRFAPGPFSIPLTTADTRMLVAPEDGYETELMLVGGYNSARSFYLRHGDGDRYGKITRFEFRDETRGEIDQGGFSLQGFVQTEATGSRTVYALSPTLASERKMANRGIAVAKPEVTGRPIESPKPRRAGANNGETRRKVLILVGAFLVSAIGFFLVTGFMGKRRG